MKHATLDFLLQMAFGKHDYEIAGEPGWVNSEEYDIEAKTDDGARIDPRSLRGPLQNLLQQRFHLRTHREQKTMSGYALVIAKAGSKLKPAKDNESNAVYVMPESVRGQRITLEGVASLLSMSYGRPVTDRTGIKGFYDMDLKFAAASNPNSNLPDFFTAIEEQLGLKLESAATPFEILAIDHVDRIPTED